MTRHIVHYSYFPDIPREVFEKTIEYIKPFYKEKNRVYHNFSHIEFFLQEFYNNYYKVCNRLEFFLALTFHDIVYDFDEYEHWNNEIYSYEKFFEFYDKELLPLIREKKCPYIKINLVELFIIGTTFHLREDFTTSLTIEQNNTRLASCRYERDLLLFLDMDMSLFSKQYGNFVKLDNKLLREYCNIYDRDKVLKGRKDFFLNLLGIRNNIYYTPIYDSYIAVENINKRIVEYDKLMKEI